MHGFHHVRARVRQTRGLEPFPSKIAWKRPLDYLMYGVGVFAPLALLPQILQVYRTKSASGLSLSTWALITLANCLWALYGAAHKDRQLFLANVFMMFCNLIVVMGILLYS